MSGHDTRSSIQQNKMLIQGKLGTLSGAWLYSYPLLPNGIDDRYDRGNKLF